MRRQAGICALVVVVGVVAHSGLAAVRASAAIWRWSSPAAVDPDGGGFAGVACPTAHFCIALDANGRIVTSHAPTARRSAWTAPESLDAGAPFSGLTCRTSRLCVATEPFGGTIITTDPAGGVATWRSAGPGYFDSLACPTAALCVAVRTDSHGTSILTARHPGQQGTTWTRRLLTASSCRGICGYQLACPTSRLCVAVDAYGTLLTSTNPTGGRHAWNWANIDPRAVANHPTSISCASVSLCLIGDGAGGHVFISRHPAGGARTWRRQTVGFELNWLSCPLRDLCLANQSDAFPLLSESPLGGASSWQWTAIDPASALVGIACPTRTVCVAVDGLGDVVTGRALVAPRLVGPGPAISGRARIDSVLRGSTGRWAGSGPVGYLLHWERCDPGCVPIRGARGTQLVLTRALLRARIRLLVTAYNAAGSSDAVSAETKPVGSAR